MKTFLSIGAGPGIGYATALRFAREGFRVVLSARDEAKTNALTDKLRGAGFQADARRVDATDPSSVASLIADVEAQHGQIDVLHYNAASLRKAALAEQPTETFNSDLAVNIGGALVASQAALPAMLKRESGSILLTGGFFGINPNADFLSLSLGKAGIRALALGLFDSAKESGVHVATVTVAAFVEPDSVEAAGIADAFWSLHSQPKAEWSAESTYSR